jgi:hypothetical protein
MLVLRKLKSYIFQITLLKYDGPDNRHSINSKYIGLYKWEGYNFKCIYLHNGCKIYTVYHMLNDLSPYYSLSLTIYSGHYNAETYYFNSYKRDFSDIKYEKI